MTEPRPPLSTGRVLRLLLAVGARRWVNRASGQFGKAFRRKKDTGRTATPGKHQPSRLGTLFVTALFLFLGFNVSAGMVTNLAASIRDSKSDTREVVDRWTMRRIATADELLRATEQRVRERGDDPVAARRQQREALANHLVEDLVDHDIPDDIDPLTQLAPAQRRTIEHTLEVFDARGAAGFRTVDTHEWLGVHREAAHSEQFRTVVALILCLSFLCTLLLSIGNSNTELGHVDWSMQWLFTFPVRSRALFTAKVVEYTLINALSWIFHLSFLSAVFWTLGFGGWAFLIAIAGTLYINLLLAVSRLLLETWLRKRLPLQRLKNLQAVSTAIGTLSLFCLYMLSNRALPFELRSLAVVPESSVTWLPWSLPIALVRGGGIAYAAIACMLVAGVAITTTGVWTAEHLVRDGLLVGGSEARRQRGAAPTAGSRFRGIVGRELLLLVRDRNLLVQTLILPILVIGFQVVFTPKMFTGSVDDPRHASALAFGIGAYVLMGGGFMALINEGRALWLLFTFPQRLERILLRKATVWSAAAMAYTFGVLVVVAVLAGGVDADTIVGGVTALVGVALFGAIAVGMGILGTDPFTEEVQRKVRPTVMWTYMMLAGLFGTGFYASPWNKLVLIIVCTLLAIAIWQIVADRLPLLLDPVRQPAPQIALSDGLIAVLMFFVFQSAVVAAGLKSKAPPEQLVLIAFVVAGILVAVLLLLVLWRRGVPNILATIGIRASQGATSSLSALLHGIVLGAGAGAVGVLYQMVALSGERRSPPTLLAVLAIVAAPLCEELIFRGLLFRGLRRSTRAATAILASAAIFAIVHPPVSFVPVFGLGVVTAFGLERTGRLIAPICAHAVYNAMVLFAN